MTTSSFAKSALAARRKEIEKNKQKDRIRKMRRIAEAEKERRDKIEQKKDDKYTKEQEKKRALKLEAMEKKQDAENSSISEFEEQLKEKESKQKELAEKREEINEKLEKLQEKINSPLSATSTDNTLININEKSDHRENSSKIDHSSYNPSTVEHFATSSENAIAKKNINNKLLKASKIKPENNNFISQLFSKIQF